MAATKVPVSNIKQAVKKSIKVANQVIKTGQSAIAANQKKLKVAKTKGEKKRLLSANKKNKKTLAKAKKALASLDKSRKIADSLCPLQIQLSPFSYS